MTDEQQRERNRKMTIVSNELNKLMMELDKTHDLTMSEWADILADSLKSLTKAIVRKERSS